MNEEIRESTKKASASDVELPTVLCVRYLSHFFAQTVFVLRCGDIMITKARTTEFKLYRI